MKVKRMGIIEILRRIWLFSANKTKSSESFSKAPTQLIVKLNSSLPHIIVTFTISYHNYQGSYQISHFQKPAESFCKIFFSTILTQANDFLLALWLLQFLKCFIKYLKVRFIFVSSLDNLDKRYEVKVHFWSVAKVVFRLNAHPRIQILNSLECLYILYNFRKSSTITKTIFKVQPA